MSRSVYDSEEISQSEVNREIDAHTNAWHKEYHYLFGMYRISVNVLSTSVYYQENIRDKSVQLHILTGITVSCLKWHSNAPRMGMVSLQ